jgi:hypothetical protein
MGLYALRSIRCVWTQGMGRSGEKHKGRGEAPTTSAMRNTNEMRKDEFGEHGALDDMDDGMTETPESAGEFGTDAGDGGDNSSHIRRLEVCHCPVMWLFAWGKRGCPSRCSEIQGLIAHHFAADLGLQYNVMQASVLDQHIFQMPIVYSHSRGHI